MRICLLLAGAVAGVTLLTGCGQEGGAALGRSRSLTAELSPYAASLVTRFFWARRVRLA